MNTPTGHGSAWRSRCLLVAILVLLAGCAQVTEKLEVASNVVFGADDVQFIELRPTAARVDARNGKTDSVTPDLYCTVPQEEFDYAEVLRKRFGTEAVLRLEQLMRSDFTRAELTPQQKKMLDVLALETLWIPAGLESLLGDLLFRQEKEGLKSVPQEGARAKYWTTSAELYAPLLNVAPKMPFDTRLAILYQGRPNALAGGRIFVDQETVRMTVESDAAAQRSKLAFIYAHELAHVFKRHKAKRIQQLLIETDEGLKIVRELVTGLDPSGKMARMAWIRQVFDKMTTGKRMIELLGTEHAQFSRAQEHEADACATGLMIAAGLGDPVVGFNTYLANHPKGSPSAPGSAMSPYEQHPPNDARVKIIAEVKTNFGKKRK